MPRRKQNKIQPAPARKPWEIPVGGGEYGINLDVYFGMLEKEIGLSIIAYDAEEDSIIFGQELMEALNEEGERGIEKAPRCEAPVLSLEHEHRLEGAEKELGYSLVAYDMQSDTLMYGGPLIDKLCEKYGVGGE